jgi:hypothetical protein
MDAKILLTKTPDLATFREDMLAAGLAEEVPATDVDGGTEIDVTGTHTTQETVWVDSNGNPTEPVRDDEGNITNDAQQASYIYVLTLLTDRAVQVSQYVTFDPDSDLTYVGDLQAGLAVGQSEVIWDTSQSEKAPGNLTVGWAGHDVETKPL